MFQLNDQVKVWEKQDRRWYLVKVLGILEKDADGKQRYLLGAKSPIGTFYKRSLKVGEYPLSGQMKLTDDYQNYPYNSRWKIEDVDEFVMDMVKV
jgi:hypothetical protein